MLTAGPGIGAIPPQYVYASTTPQQTGYAPNMPYQGYGM